MSPALDKKRMVIRRVQLLPWSDRFFSSGDITLTPTSEEEGRSNHILFVELRRFLTKLSGIHSLLQYNSCFTNTLKTKCGSIQSYYNWWYFRFNKSVIIFDVILTFKKIYLCTAIQRLFTNTLKTNIFRAITTDDIFTLTNLLILDDVLL